MVVLDTKGDLAIAELAFFGVAFLFSIAVCVRQRIFKAGGLFWIYLGVISVLRLLGEGCTLYMMINNTYSKALTEAATIASAVGTAPLLLVLMGIVERGAKGLVPNIFRPIHIVTMIGLVLAIVGGVFQGSKDASRVTIGNDCSKAGSVIFVASFLALGFLTLGAKVQMGRVIERKLITASLLVLPFLIVRIAYTVAVSFAGSDPTSQFYYTNINVWIQIGMMFAMEAVIVIVFTWAGLMEPPRQKMYDQSHKEYRGSGSESSDNRQRPMNGRGY